MIEDGRDNSLTVIDNRTGHSYKVLIEDGHYINAAAFKAINSPTSTDIGESEGIMLYDPSFVNTAVTRSAICWVEGEKGLLLYRGYPIEELLEKSNFLEVAYLLIYGHLPSKVA